ncbi:MAG: GNAT family N-acetyltransferase [Lachnospiraceae bacterium]|nr:GNAT family N-acetyltransferase [Lachnospiraceae bacterium]
MKKCEYEIRVMTMDDYKAVYALWQSIHGFGIRSIDDSEEGVRRFIDRNPNTSMVAVCEGRIIGAILCGHDGRRGTFYHVCVQEEYRKQGIGKAMAVACMRALKEEHINKATLVAFTSNSLGNQFWKGAGWTYREDLNYYDFTLNEANITEFNK